MAMNSSGMTGKIALKKEEFQEKREEFQEKREEHREKYEAKKRSLQRKVRSSRFRASFSCSPDQGRYFQIGGFGIVFCAYGGRVRAYRAVDRRAIRA